VALDQEIGGLVHLPSRSPVNFDASPFGFFGEPGRGVGGGDGGVAAAGGVAGGAGAWEKAGVAAAIRQTATLSLGEISLRSKQSMGTPWCFRHEDPRRAREELLLKEV